MRSDELRELLGVFDLDGDVVVDAGVFVFPLWQLLKKMRGQLDKTHSELMSLSLEVGNLEARVKELETETINP
jgi:hypothetical protein